MYVGIGQARVNERALMVYLLSANRADTSVHVRRSRPKRKTRRHISLCAKVNIYATWTSYAIRERLKESRYWTIAVAWEGTGTLQNCARRS